MNNKITAIFIVAIFLMSFGVVLAADGDVIWKREYDGNGPDYAMGVATDSYNNVIVTGYSFMGDNLDNLNYCTIKYDAAGNIIWKREYDGGDEDGAKGVATDSYNNVIVTGISEIGGRRSDYCTIKYDPNGNVVWEKEYDSGFDDFANGVATDSYNNVIVTGYSIIGGKIRYCTIKYDPNGNIIWKRSTIAALMTLQTV
ncbi:MAG TPA: hypothetical protein P5140_07820 [Methanofastidiosum sp.]|nr:hypothetical protein [Methanofastidiosum sp.]